MKKIIQLLSCLILSVPFLGAQSVNIMEDYNVSRVMDRYVNFNKNTSVVEGWRIQLVATTDRRKMEQDRQEFMQNYPDISVDWTHEKPYYRLRAGAYRTKLEALRAIQKIKRDYPSAFPAKDSNIEPREFMKL